MLFGLVSSVNFTREPRCGGCSLKTLGRGSLAEPRILIPSSEMAVEGPGVVVTTLSAQQRWGRGTPSM